MKKYLNKFTSIIIFSFMLLSLTTNGQINVSINDLSFDQIEIEVGSGTNLHVEVEMIGDDYLNPGTINIQFSFPYNSYASVFSQPPIGRDAHYFQWSLDENNFWNGINYKPLPTDKFYLISIPVIGLHTTQFPQTCDVHIRAIRDLDLFENDDPTDNYAQAALSIIENSDLLSYTQLVPATNSNFVSIDSDLAISFPESIDMTQGLIQIRECKSNYLHQQVGSNHPSISVVGNTLTISPNEFDIETCYYVLIEANAITATSSSKTFIGIHSPEEWVFTTSDFCSNQPEPDLSSCEDQLVISNDLELDAESRTKQALELYAEATISGNGHMTYNGENRLRLTEGFRINENIGFRAQIKECEEINSSIDVQVFLQGALADGGGETYLSAMRTDLVSESVLPNSSLNENPYYNDPWDFNTCIPTSSFDNGFNSNITDWVLVELRLNLNESSVICQKVGLLFKGGQVEFPDGGLCDVKQGDKVHIVVKHRNHLPIISPQVIVDKNNVANYDFVSFNSLKGRETLGQVRLPNGKYAMAAGNCEQSEAIFSQYSIQNLDFNSLRSYLTNNHSLGFVIGQDPANKDIIGYFNEDLDMNGKVDFFDKRLLESNLNLIGSLFD